MPRRGHPGAAGALVTVGAPATGYGDGRKQRPGRRSVEERAWLESDQIGEALAAFRGEFQFATADASDKPASLQETPQQCGSEAACNMRTPLAPVQACSRERPTPLTRTLEVDPE